MVLLTAVKNFRQYNTKKGSNALSLGDLSGLSVVERCPGTLSTVTPGKEMERYHAAFPALGAAEPVSYVQQFDLSNFAGRNGESNEMLTQRHFEEIPAGDVGSVKSKGSTHRQPKHQHAKERSGHLNGTKNHHHNNHNQTRRPTSRYQSPKHRKCFRDRNVDSKPTTKTAKKDSKPWKHLDPVEREACVPQTPKMAETGAVGGEVWISDELLQAVLVDDVPKEPDLEVHRLRSLWTNDKPSESSLWVFDGSNTQTDAFTGAEASPADISAEELCNDFSFIEESLSQLQLDDPIPDVCNGSKLMPLFNENEFCRMILNGEPAASDGVQSLSVCPPLSCRHCEETYEVILDLESSTRSKHASHPLLSEIDSRLNFDWCKYEPPPWSTANKTESVIDDGQGSRYLCGCEFCRSRIWTRSCRVCGTPPKCT